MQPVFDPSAWGQVGRATPPPPATDPLPQVPPGGRYFTGPIPLGWVQAAARLPGRAWHLGCALWHLARLKKGRAGALQLTARLRTTFGLADRQAYYRALTALERAHLVRVERRAGRSPLLTILPAPGPSGAEEHHD